MGDFKSLFCKLVFIGLLFLIAACGSGGGEGASNGGAGNAGGGGGPAGDDGGTAASGPGTINLAWNPPARNADGSPLTDLAGYGVYYGTSPGVYTQRKDVGNSTSCSLTGLVYGQTYYIAITAYDLSNNESDQSSPISGVAK